MPTLNEKLVLWEHRLLDLSRRNKLIHCVQTRRGFIALNEPGMEALYDALVTKRMPLRFKHPVTREYDPSVFSLQRLMEFAGVPFTASIGDIGTNQSGSDLERTLQVLMRKARSALAEQGQHVLHLSFGFVRWSDGSATNHSPLLLLPVTLNRSTSPDAFSLQADAEDLIVNPTLVHLFAEKFRYRFPDYTGTPAAYFDRLQGDFAQRGWSISQEECRLGVFAFQRMALYHDIKANADQFSANPILQQMYAPDTAPPAATAVPAGPPCCILSADSTQAEAVNLSRKGVSFIIQGAPGTGKSNTICNLISAALADGKKVLFVASKKAALDIVHQRLVKAGLGRFVLALHNTSKARSQVVKELGESLHQRVISAPDAFETAQMLKLLNEKLQRYPLQLHQLRPLGITLADAFAKVSTMADVPLVYIPIENITQMDRIALLSTLDRISGIASAAQTAPLWGDYQPQFHHGDLQPVISALEEAHVPPKNYAAAYEKAFYMSWIRMQLADSPDVAFFDSNTQATNMAHFRAGLDRMLELSRIELQHKLSSHIRSRLPLLSAEAALLDRECHKKARHLPTRALFNRIPNLVNTLKPVLLLSPLAVAELLDASLYKPDVVIFDEASQLYPEDALGAILRSRQAIICGDTQQLPPTSFFNASSEDTRDEEDVDDALPLGTSLLEEAIYSLPQTSLLYHYRSEFEALISFSNEHFYNGRLRTFPQAHLTQPDTGVELIRVDGVYIKQRNRPVAEECVRLIFDHIRRYSDRSLGVITFSIQQQDEIETLLWEERLRHPEFEPFFSEGGDQPFFVRNLENVQGDERDTIILSVAHTYGQDGKLRLNFGPLAQPGGERRLNVAVTRARINMKVVASLHPHEIDLNRAHSQGAQLLRAYLEYASRGARPTLDAQVNTAIANPFTDVVARFLEKNGYSIAKNIGLSDCTVDIGILSPDGDFSAGILCDGGSGSPSPQDDVIRRKMLERMGWTILECYSVEWARNPAKAQTALLEVLHNASSGIPLTPQISLSPVVAEYEPEAETIHELSLPPYAPASDSSYTYQVYLQQDYPQFTFDQGCILHFIREESPIHLSVLYQRMAGHYARQKVTSVVRESVNKQIQKLLNKHVTIIEEAFCMLKHKRSITPRQAGPREIDHISLMELGEVIRMVVKRTPGITRDAAIQEACTLLGFIRPGPLVEERLYKAIEAIEARQLIESNGTNRIYPKEHQHGEDAY